MAGTHWDQLVHAAMQSQKTVTAYFTSNQLLPFGFAWECTAVKSQNTVNNLSCSHNSLYKLPFTVFWSCIAVYCHAKSKGSNCNSSYIILALHRSVRRVKPKCSNCSLFIEQIPPFDFTYHDNLPSTWLISYTLIPPAEKPSFPPRPGYHSFRTSRQTASAASGGDLI